MRVRRAGPADAPAVARLVDALNAQQGDPTGNLTPERVAEALSGPRPAFHAILAVAQAGEALGVATWEPTYELAYAVRGGYLSALYVAPEARARGIGRALLEAAAADVEEAGGIFLWWVSQAWNAEAHAAYEAMTATDVTARAHALTFDAFGRAASRGARRLQGDEDT